jgi:hypothetical protein
MLRIVVLWRVQRWYARLIALDRDDRRKQITSHHYKASVTASPSSTCPVDSSADVAFERATVLDGTIGSAEGASSVMPCSLPVGVPPFSLTDFDLSLSSLPPLVRDDVSLRFDLVVAVEQCSVWLARASATLETAQARFGGRPRFLRGVSDDLFSTAAPRTVSELASTENSSH